MVTQGWDRAARLYDTPILRRLAYRAPQDEIITQLAQRIVDVGCGTGILVARIATDPAPAAVYGCDASAGMLKQTMSRSARVEWRHRRAEDLGLPDAAVDAVVSTHAFHFFDHHAASRVPSNSGTRRPPCDRADTPPADSPEHCSPHRYRASPTFHHPARCAR
ncbi:class I SAM-dependent methyltransferase [Nocardia sp. NPDC051463]|uniref:class I SAM-dependent methyltransferase n=1 Tax=Nocardia sp. NPDC051463 TaxID=3154845 RepID=UPI00344C46F0